MDISDIQAHISKKGIKLLGMREHLKATEKYIDVVFSYPDQSGWNGSVPYYYRRTALFLESPQEIVAHIEMVYEALQKGSRRKWVATERRLWNKEHKNKIVTKPFFDKLLNLKWNCVDGDLPTNPNWARRIQDIKEMGYTLATDTNRFNPKLKKNATHILLLPIEKEGKTGYETISAKLRKRIIQVLGNYDAYEGKVRQSGLLPDHKFPEISWDGDVKQANPDDMSEEDIKAKFQLLDNQRNLEKREACRLVFQTGKLGNIFGIDYYINGSEDWPENVPKTGRASEEGWKLCPWYDIEVWRQSLNDFIAENQEGT